MVYPLAGLRTWYAAEDPPQFDSALGWTQNLSAAWSLSVLKEHGDLRPDSCGFLVKGDAGNGINPFGFQLLPAIRDATSQTERWIDKA